MRRHGVTFWNSVPALVQLLADNASPGDLATLRTVVMAGDWIPPDLGARPDRGRQRRRPGPRLPARRRADQGEVLPPPLDRRARLRDLGRYLPDGTIEILGRDDFQVQVGGHRIELGEIESTAERHPDVQSCVVVATDSASGGKRLVCFVVGSPEITDFLKAQLGGDSLTGTRYARKLSETFDVSLSVRDVFTSPTCARLAAELARDQRIVDFAQAIAELAAAEEPAVEPVAGN
ncbi:hypothetical protein UK23_36110 [Lentzea aerocolonigenes]|uniref:Carrier domain-containing protein n=1 Tax=Lentzea aerocolonigenes TaxID=68170 RepID=A0A0F0GL30_LENAE|nr:non-ribosomal peptide synthetase [Lentzea aerocolonigenes]KJK42677.1 hypothetical protein UK23_36110 [Lentzea aerocolonigenes]